MHLDDPAGGSTRWGRRNRGRPGARTAPFTALSAVPRSKMAATFRVTKHWSGYPNGSSRTLDTATGWITPLVAHQYSSIVMRSSSKSLSKKCIPRAFSNLHVTKLSLPELSPDQPHRLNPGKDQRSVTSRASPDNSTANFKRGRR